MRSVSIKQLIRVTFWIGCAWLASHGYVWVAIGLAAATFGAAMLVYYKQDTKYVDYYKLNPECVGCSGPVDVIRVTEESDSSSGAPGVATLCTDCATRESRECARHFLVTRNH